MDVWEENSTKIDVVFGNQEQQYDQQGFLKITGTKSSGNILLGSDIQTMLEGDIWRIQIATGISTYIMLMAET